MRTWVALLFVVTFGVLLSLRLHADPGEVTDSRTGTDPGKRSFTDRQREKLSEYLMETFVGRFLIRGTVVDQDGSRLKGVTMEVSSFTPDGPEGKTVGRSQTVEESFSLDIKRAMTIELKFSKEGYYSAETNFALPHSPDGLEQRIEEAVLKGEKPKLDRRECKAENVTIVLEKQGELTSLVRFAGVLEYQVGGKGKVIDFDRPPRPDVENQYLRVIPDLRATNTTPANHAYLLPDLDADGRVAMVTKKSAVSGEDYQIPKRLTLVLNGRDSGSLLGDLGNWETTGRRMRKAPDDANYQRTLVLDAVLLERMVNSVGVSKYQWFFFKVNGKYGKGRISPADLISRDHSRVLLGVQFLLQPNGTRNLETGE